jgi:predicted transcriptional regulator
LENGKNLGSISEKSITAEIAKGSAKDLANRTVREAMSEPFPMVGRRSRMEVILSLLQESSAVLVLDDGKVSGIITKADVLPRLRTGLSQGGSQGSPASDNSR